ncbi:MULTISPECIES: hypothetical protein [Pantoea]|uniref:Uncharacterized protein n=1 Tax=Candidatus Pantoea floridensis TaxID=1938870 RepID=A0A286DL06_9GAMM|nr:hypothetical protein [Pantoea floridensis]PIF14879.1 hypothetical protein BX596_3980 [Enterobacteriaceae bacterium JKS000233]SOD59316.1 hypothetical protein SAMN06273570_4235 [Pantoea floridensis]
MRTLRKPGDIRVGSPFMVTDSRLTDEHYAMNGGLTVLAIKIATPQIVHR